jgi:hypothetical protein
LEQYAAAGVELGKPPQTICCARAAVATEHIYAATARVLDKANKGKSTGSRANARIKTNSNASTAAEGAYTNDSAE